MSRRRRREHEAGPVRKTVEVVVSALFGMAVVGVVLALLQGGTSPASQGPYPSASAAGQTGLGYGGDGGIGIRSADPGVQSTAGTIYSAQPAPAPTGSAPGATPTRPTGTGEPTGTPGTGAATTTGSPGASATGTARATASASSSAGSGALGGVVGGLVGGVLGLL